jgi:hypothetical protein
MGKPEAWGETQVSEKNDEEKERKTGTEGGKDRDQNEERRRQKQRETQSESQRRRAAGFECSCHHAWQVTPVNFLGLPGQCDIW